MPGIVWLRVNQALTCVGDVEAVATCPCRVQHGTGCVIVQTEMYIVGCAIDEKVELATCTDVYLVTYAIVRVSWQLNYVEPLLVFLLPFLHQVANDQVVVTDASRSCSALSIG